MRGRKFRGRPYRGARVYRGRRRRGRSHASHIRRYGATRGGIRL